MQKVLPPILLAAMALDLGGAETHVISLARELHRRGHKVVVASAGGRLVDSLQEAGVVHCHAPMASRSPVEMLRAYWRLQEIIAEHQIGLVHAHARIPAWLVSLLLRRRPLPFVTTYHGAYNAGFPWKYLTTFGQRTIAVSEDVRMHLTQRLGCPSDQVRVIPNGFDTEQFRSGLDIAPLLKEFDVDARGPHIVQASRMSHDYYEVPLALMASLPEVERALPGVRLWVLGDGEYSAQVRQAAEETNRKLGRTAVVATGVRRDVPQFFNLADCVVAVARTASEAMSCGRPVIIAGEGGYRGILTPERIASWSGANFTAREEGRRLDPGLLARDLIDLLRPEAAAERQRLGQAGRQYVVDHLSIEATTEEVLNVYAEVL